MHLLRRNTRRHVDDDTQQDVQPESIQLPSDAPPILYHYTAPEGLLGIIESRTLWATDAEFLNDAQELQFGRAELREALLRAAEELSADSGAYDAAVSRATVMRSAADHLEPPGGLWLEKQAHSVHVACFCEAGDLLSQWRGYGQSGGVAIGFRAEALCAVEVRMPDGTPVSEHAYVIQERPRLVKIRYGEEAIRPVIDDVLARIAPEPTGHPGVQGFHRARSIVLPALATIKHSAFVEEREWRLIQMTSHGELTLLHRAGPLGVIPYIQCSFSDDAITEVVVGPARDREVRRRGIERLLQTQRLDEVKVRLSDAPFRG